MDGANPTPIYNKEVSDMIASTLKNSRPALLVIGLLAFGISSAAHSATWIASCSDGKNIQYNQTINGNGLLYMKVRGDKGRMHTWQIAKMQQTFYNGTAVCGSVLKNGRGNAATGNNPITQVCANKSRKTIYLKYKHPYEVRPFDSGVYCKATITVR